MPTILVPGPSPDAFNKQRRISDLLHSQITHFQHLAYKRSLAIDPKLAADVHTEAGAARFIAAVTRALRSTAEGAHGLHLVATPVTQQGASVHEAPAASTLLPDAPAAGTLPTLAAAAIATPPTKPASRRRKPRPKP